MRRFVLVSVGFGAGRGGGIDDGLPAFCVIAGLVFPSKSPAPAVAEVMGRSRRGIVSAHV